MAVTTSRVLRLTFTTAGGKTLAITIPNPREDLQQAEAVAVMDSIIASDLFLTSSGALTGIRDIRVIDTTTDDLFDPPQA
ncbi:DUF2922 domain-containing protein [Desulfosporosinus metallidurans]|uniref:DUF2922 domain-containing protein n=1 Tax=Desulfosporosinus metallidurans TaxID=1888891 RepID=A0A1Q8QKZ8_9FIRM|nr:DUF2922 domain-containing protein [Desulfosporosinus metallidurans]OLN27938.1 hypothetical protein DSOL_4297 [Desulfosporosinus metallidurans]